MAEPASSGATPNERNKRIEAHLFFSNLIT
jgi:hypothetical protein